MEVTFNPVWPWWAGIPLAVGLVWFALWTYPPTAPRRTLLLGLRLVAIAIALFAFLRPSLIFIKKVKQSSTLIILADRSRSMNLSDMWANQSRWEVLTKLWHEAKPDLDALAENVRVVEHGFDTQLTDFTPEMILKGADGNHTAVGDALKDSVEQAGDERLAGVILLTDGANNFGADIAEIRRELGVKNIPVYSFGFGSETATEHVRDIAPIRITAGDYAYKKKRHPVKAEFSLAGFARQQIPVKLLFDGKEQAKGELKIDRDNQTGMVELVGIPETHGDVKVTIEAEPQPGELLPNNNSISTYLPVDAEGLAILQIEGKYRFWEPRFLKRALGQAQGIDLTQVFVLERGRDAELPDDLLQPGKVDVIILGDIAANRLSKEQHDALVKLVEGGAGLLMVGGYESFGPGGWGGVKLGELLPVEMRAGDAQSDKELRFVPTAQGLRHYILRLAVGEEANRKAWELLRPLDGGNTFAGLKRTAMVLAETADGQPLLVAQEIGRSRVLAFAADTTWRWAMKDQIGRAGHAAFWRQLILWLAHREDAVGNSVRIRLERRRLALGEKLGVEITVRDAKGNPLPDVQLQTALKTPQGDSLPITLRKQGDVYRAVIAEARSAGDYQVTVIANRGNDVIGTTGAKFLVYEDDAELKQLAADFESLRKLAADTKGEFHTAEEFPKFVKSLQNRDLNLEITKPVDQRLWDNWVLLALFIGVLSLEWFLRKRNGLV